MWRLFRNNPKLVDEICLQVEAYFIDIVRMCVCVRVWQRCVVPAGVCNGTSIICSNSNQLPPSPPRFCFFLHSIHSLSFLPQVKLATLKDYNTVPDHHMLSLWVCVPTCFACSLTWCLPSLAAKACQLLRDKNKNRGEQRGDTRYTNMCVCITVCVHPAGCFAMRQGHMVTPGKAGWACLPASLWVMSVSFSA